jgi:hypothetical protein
VLAAKRSLIEAELKDNPVRSDRQVGAELGVDHKTVGAARKKLEDGGEFSQHEKRVARAPICQLFSGDSRNP